MQNQASRDVLTGQGVQGFVQGSVGVTLEAIDEEREESFSGMVEL